MATSLDFSIGILTYLVLISLFVGILSIGGVLHNSGVEIITNPSIGTNPSIPGVCAVRHYCQAQGEISLDDSTILLFTYNKDNTNFTVNGIDWCETCCKNEDSYGYFSGFVYGYSCQGQCVNLTYSGGGNYTACNADTLTDLSVQTQSVVSTFIGFFTFQTDLGLGQFNFIIATIFVYLPLLALVLCIFWWLRGNG